MNYALLIITEKIFLTRLDNCKKKKKDINFSLLIENEEIVLHLFLACYV